MPRRSHLLHHVLLAAAAVASLALAPACDLPSEDSDRDNSGGDSGSPGAPDRTPCVVGDWVFEGNTGIGECSPQWGVTWDWHVRVVEGSNGLQIGLVGDRSEIVESAEYTDLGSVCELTLHIEDRGENYGFVHVITLTSYADGSIEGQQRMVMDINGDTCYQDWWVEGYRQ